MRTPLALLVGCLVTLSASAQSAVGWQAYPAYNEVTAVASAPDGLWAASNAGIFFYDVGTGELLTETAAGAIEGGPVGALAVDEARGVLWIGYEDGVLERYDPEAREARAFYEIARANQYPARGVRRIVVSGDVLYVATDFGVVVFDAAAERVRNAYPRFADLEGGTGANDVLEAPLPDGQPGLWVATDGGLVRAPRDAGNLQAPGSWTRAEAFEGPAFSLALFDGALYVGGGPDGARDLYRRREDGAYERQLFTDNPLLALVPADGLLYAVSPLFAYAVRPPGQASSYYVSSGAVTLSGLALEPGRQPLGRRRGRWAVPAPAATRATGREPASRPTPSPPPGPLSTNILDIDVSDEGVAVGAVTQERNEAGAVPPRSTDWRTERGRRTLTDDASVDIGRASWPGI